MKNLVFNALAFKDGFQTSTQIENDSKKIETYIKNSFVSLMSCKIKNPECDVCLLTSVNLPTNYKKLFDDNNIIIKKIDFDEFNLSKEYTWSLAFFKLKALKYVVENLDYDNYLMLDTDTFTTNSLDDLWLECAYGLVLYDLDHRISHPHRMDIYNNSNKYTSPQKPINHYGGEFIAGNKEILGRFVIYLFNEYVKMKNCSTLDKTLGDEFLISIVADKFKSELIRANSYIYRYWTTDFYLVSTNYMNNAVDIWHLPQEKELGILWLYDYYLKHKTFPQLDTCAKKFDFPSYKMPLKKLIKLKYRSLLRILK